MATITLTGDCRDVRWALDRFSAAVGPEGRAALHGIAGHRMVNTEIPRTFREGGPGWPPITHRSGRPLLDTGTLARSITYRADAREVAIGSNLRQAHLMNEGGVVTPTRAKFLTIPLSPPLTSTQRRVAKPSDFPKAFVLMKGPEGPGIYRKKGRRIERIFAFARKVRIKARPFLRWTEANLASIARLWADELRRSVTR